MYLGIPTAMSDLELGYLRARAKGKICLELGAQFGASTVALAQAGTKVCSVDWHRGDADAGYSNTLGQFLSNLRRNAVDVVFERTDNLSIDERRLVSDYWNGQRPDEQVGRRGTSLRKTVCAHVARFEDEVPRLGSFYEMAFLDGAHDSASVTRDLTLVRAHLRPGAEILIHDYGRYGVAYGVRAAGYQVRARYDTLAVLQPVGVLV